MKAPLRCAPAFGMDVTERTEWFGVEATVNLPSTVDPSDRAAVTKWLKENVDAWMDSLTEGEVHTDHVALDDLRIIG